MFWVFDCFFYHVFLELNLLITFVQMQKCKNRLNRFSSWDWDATSQVSQLIQIEVVIWTFGQAERDSNCRLSFSSFYAFLSFSSFLYFNVLLLFFVFVSFLLFSSFYCFLTFLPFSLLSSFLFIVSVFLQLFSSLYCFLSFSILSSF